MSWLFHILELKLIVLAEPFANVFEVSFEDLGKRNRAAGLIHLNRTASLQQTLAEQRKQRLLGEVERYQGLALDHGFLSPCLGLGFGGNLRK